MLISLLLKRPAAFLVSDLKFLNKEAPSLSGYATVNQTADSRNSLIINSKTYNHNNVLIHKPIF